MTCINIFTTKWKHNVIEWKIVRIIIVNKANEILNEELFEQRCKDQDERKAKREREEKLSIFCSQKTTYLRIKAKINREVLKEENIPCL